MVYYATVYTYIYIQENKHAIYSVAKENIEFEEKNFLNNFLQSLVMSIVMIYTTEKRKKMKFSIYLLVLKFIRLTTNIKT